ncbi:unnamed protein product, partial [Nesidiocoris tenuis]
MRSSALIGHEGGEVREGCVAFQTVQSIRHSTHPGHSGRNFESKKEWTKRTFQECWEFEAFLEN